MAKAKKCEFCDKAGLPILPVRYAIATADAGAPKTTVPNVPLGNKAAHYTLRLVRTGYIYLYDLARDTWECYFVTTEGYFFKIEVKPGVIPVLPAKPFDCPDEGHREVASCIMIPYSRNGTQVWIGFSDVRWTQDVLDKHKNAAYRERHMRVINVKAGISGPDAKHIFAIKEVNTKVAEYAMEDSNLGKAFKWSPHPVDLRHARAAKLKSECERLKPGKGLVVALADPAGIARELAMLMHYKTRAFLEQPQYKRKLAVHGVIAQMEMAIKDHAQTIEIKAGDNLANEYMSQPDFGSLISDTYAKKREARIARLRTSTPEELNRASTYEWKKYQNKYKFQEANDWKADFDKKLAQFDADYVAPLATAHATWMKRGSTASYFECNYDPKDMPSGVVYTAVLSQCIATTADKQACFDVYETWLQGSSASSANLLLNALQFNNTALKKQIQEAAQASVSWASLPWDKVAEAHDKATARLMEGQADELGRLIGLVAGPTAAALRKAAESKKVYPGLVAIGAATKHPIVQITATGSKKAFRSLLIKEMLKLGGMKVEGSGANKLQKAVAEELRRLEMHGVNLKGTQTKTWLLMIDPAEVKGMPKNLKPQAQAQWLARTIKTPEQIDALNLGNLRTRLANWSATNRGAVPLAFGMLGVLANACAFADLLEEDSKALAHTQNESLSRIVSQGAQLVGAFAGSMETAMSRMSVLSFKAAAGVASGVRYVLRITGRVLGVGGSLFMGLIDIWRGVGELQEKNASGAFAYFVSGGLGIAATVFLLIGWTGWGLIVVAALIAWTFIMTLLVDNKLQDWLERCDFGIFEKGKRYQDLETEMQEFKQATA